MKILKPWSYVLFCFGFIAVLVFFITQVRNSSIQHPDSAQAHPTAADPLEQTKSASAVHERTASLTRLIDREKSADKLFWGPEIIAQSFADFLESKWQSFNEIAGADVRWQLIRSLDIPEFILPVWASQNRFRTNLFHFSPDPKPSSLTAVKGGWSDWIDHFVDAGWLIHQIDFRHVQFTPVSTTHSASSVFDIAIHAKKPSENFITSIQGPLHIHWLGQSTSPDSQSQNARIQRLDASRLELIIHHGKSPFELVLEHQMFPSKEWPMTDPLLVADIFHGNTPEIFLLAANLAWIQSEMGGWSMLPILSPALPGIGTGLFADVLNNGSADLCVATPDGIFIYPVAGATTLPLVANPHVAWRPPSRLQHPIALSAADIDADGDLDLFLSQYKVPTLGTIFRPSWIDADDGYPSFLLINKGGGQFEDRTRECGLSKKRNRRVFSASLTDVNHDTVPDLVMVSDFAGLDLFLNDGKGNFAEASLGDSSDTKAFGMAHLLSDFNSDGLIDLFMVGMTSPTVSRLEHLKLWRPHPGVFEDRSIRKRMTYGNRLYTGVASRLFHESLPPEPLKNSGWSWGASATDFDNNGLTDLYIANGNETRSQVRDFEREFWLHDIYIDQTVDDGSATDYLTSRYAATRGAGWSYAGYEINRMLLQFEKDRFFNVAWPFGTAIQEDSRNVVTTDFDGDGRQDLILLTTAIWPQLRHQLRVYKNNLEPVGSWIGFRLGSKREHRSVLNSEIVITTTKSKQIRRLVSGDSFRAQHPAVLHFGLGELEPNSHLKVEVRWENSKQSSEFTLPINRYYDLIPPSLLRNE